MNFDESLAQSYAKKINVSTIRAKSLLKASQEAIESAKIITLNEMTSKSIFRELYEGLRQYCEAIGYIKGYKFLSHESITYFIRDVLKESSISQKFDRYRELRNRINYYGDNIAFETVKDALNQIPIIIQSLKKHIAL